MINITKNKDVGIIINGRQVEAYSILPGYVRIYMPDKVVIDLPYTNYYDITTNGLTKRHKQEQDRKTYYRRLERKKLEKIKEISKI